jgi:colanic acid biosynthesis glycosyl transferase WcaI
MNILVVTPHYSPEGFKVNDICNELLKAGHEVTVFTALPDYPQGKLFEGFSHIKGPWHRMENGIDVYRFPLVTRGNGNALRLALQYSSLVFSMSVLGLMKNVLKDIDVIFVYGVTPAIIALPAVLFKLTYDIPIVNWVTDLFLENVAVVTKINSPIINKPIEWLMHLIHERCDKLFYSSEGFKEALLKQNSAPEKLHYWPQYPQDVFQPVDEIDESIKAEFKQFADKFVVTFTGAITRFQSVPTIIEAAEILREHTDIVFVFIGDGVKRGEMQNSVKDKGLESSVYFLGRKPIETIPHYTALSDATLLSLSSNSVLDAVLPTKIQSYLACAKPVIVSANGACVEIINETKAGLASPAGDAKALAKIVLEMSNLSADERAQMGNNGLAYCQEQFDKDRLLKQLTDTMKALIPENRRNQQ